MSGHVRSGGQLPPCVVFRRTAGLSQEGLAEGADLSVSVVRKVEQGGDVRMETLHALARALGISLSPHAELRYAGLRLAECLTDALRVARSRGGRLPVLEAVTDGHSEGEKAAPPEVPG